MGAGSGESPLRRLPSVDRVLRSAPLAEVLRTYRLETVTRLVREALDGLRVEVSAAEDVPSASEVAETVRARIADEWLPGFRRVINGTGVVLHTNLARAPLSREALQAIETAAGYTDLELELTGGDRGNRQARIGRQLRALTGAEAALVTVSAASAVLLALTSLAKGREVIVSRGQLVEIGGGFRIPEILRQSGARLVEVGTTNRTRLDDYAAAVTPRTAAILHVHASNFRVVGFTEAAALGDLADLARSHGVPLIDDNGSGALLDTATFGLRHEPMVQESLAAGVDIVTFSGDKLLGGPQAGIVLGRADYVLPMMRHPLLRAVRPDKIALAALAATIHAYLRGNAADTLPVWQMIGQTPDALRVRAEGVRRTLAERGVGVELVAGESTVGGGSLPGDTLPTTLLVLPARVSARTLRTLDPPIVARTHAGRVLIDLRTVAPEDEAVLVAGLTEALSRSQ